MFKQLFKKAEQKVTDFLVEKTIRSLDWIAQEQEEAMQRKARQAKIDAIHRQHQRFRQQQWVLAELKMQVGKLSDALNWAQQEKRIFEREIEKMISLSFTRGSEGQPLSLNISLTGLFFRFLKGDQDAINAIGQALAGMVQLQFAEAMA